jgi:hypothetical protein
MCSPDDFPPYDRHPSEDDPALDRRILAGDVAGLPDRPCDPSCPPGFHVHVHRRRVVYTEPEDVDPPEWRDPDDAYRDRP